MRSCLPRTELFLVLASIQLILLLPAIINWLARTPPAGERLILAAWMGDMASLEATLAEGDRALLCDGSADLALASAAMTGKPRVVSRLLDLGVNVNVADRFGVTPLMYAAMRDRQETVRLLLSRGADPRMRLPVNGPTVVQIAANAGADKTVKTLQGWSEQAAREKP